MGVARARVNALAPRRALALALGLGLAARVGVLTVGLADPQRFFTLDAGQYMQLARDLRGGYLEPASDMFSVGLLRTPGYPLFAAPWLSAGGPAAVVAGQIVLSAVVVALAFVLARRLFDAPAAGLAAIVLALDPASIVYTCLLQPETLFTLLLLASALAWWTALLGSVAAAALTGALVGLATLTRPIAVFLPLALLVTPWLRSEFRKARRPAVVIALLLPFALIAGGWIARNALVAGAPVLSTIEGTNLLYYRAAGALAEERGARIEETRAELEREIKARVPPGATSAERSRIESARAIEILGEHRKGAVTSALRGAAKLLAGTGLTALSGLRGDREPERVEGGLEVMLGGLFAFVLAMLYLASCWGAATAIRRDHRASLAFLGVLLLYFLLISTGPEANTRFRVPMTPFLAALAGLGWSRMLAR